MAAGEELRQLPCHRFGETVRLRRRHHLQRLLCHRRGRRGQRGLEGASSLVRGVVFVKYAFDTMGENVTMNQSNHERRMGMKP